jgi:hypothetical protein
MTEVEAELREMLDAELQREEERENGCTRRTLRLLRCEAEGDAASSSGKGKAKARRQLSGLVVRVVCSLAAIAALGVSIARSIRAHHPSPSSSSSSSSASTIALAMFSSFAIYAALFAQLRVWPLIPGPAAQSLRGVDGLEEVVHGTAAGEGPPDTPPKLSPGSPLHSSTGEAAMAMGKRRSSQYHHAGGGDQLGILDASCNSLEALDYHSDVEFFDTINIDDSHGKGSHYSMSSQSSGSRVFVSAASGTGTGPGNGTGETAAALFPSLSFSFDKNGNHRTSGRRASSLLIGAVSGGGAGGGGGGGGGGEEAATAFNPLNSPTFV